MGRERRQGDLELFDKVLFGKWLEAERKGLGFGSTRSLAAAIDDITGFRTASQTLRNIELGSNEIGLSQIIAISYTLHGELLSNRMVELIKNAADVHLALKLAFPEYVIDGRLEKPANAIPVANGDKVGFVFADPDAKTAADVFLSGVPRSDLRPNPLTNFEGAGGCTNGQ